jgi:autoinducer 2-degrading protein
VTALAQWWRSKKRFHFGDIVVPKVILEGYILVPGADLPSVIEELPNHIRLTLQEEGCLVFEVLPEKEDASRFRVYEEFSDGRSFELHQERVIGSRWGEVTANVERHYQVRGYE